MGDADRAAVIRRRRMVQRIAPAGIAGAWAAPTLGVPAVTMLSAAGAAAGLDHLIELHRVTQRRAPAPVRRLAAPS